MMFQSYALFPHLDALDNVAFSLKMRGVAKAERQRAPASCSTGCRWARSRTAGPASSPAGSSSAWRWPGR